MDKKTRNWAENVINEFATLLAELAAKKITKDKFVELINDTAKRAIKDV